MPKNMKVGQTNLQLVKIPYYLLPANVTELLSAYRLYFFSTSNIYVEFAGQNGLEKMSSTIVVNTIISYHGEIGYT